MTVTETYSIKPAWIKKNRTAGLAVVTVKSHLCLWRAGSIPWRDQISSTIWFFWWKYLEWVSLTSERAGRKLTVEWLTCGKSLFLAQVSCSVVQILKNVQKNFRNNSKEQVRRANWCNRTGFSMHPDAFRWMQARIFEDHCIKFAKFLLWKNQLTDEWVNDFERWVRSENFTDFLSASAFDQDSHRHCRPTISDQNSSCT